MSRADDLESDTENTFRPERLVIQYYLAEGCPVYTNDSIRAIAERFERTLRLWCRMLSLTFCSRPRSYQRQHHHRIGSEQ